MKGDLGIIKNNRGITRISIAARVYNALLLNHIKPEIEKNSLKESERLSEKSLHILTDSDNLLNHRRSTCKESRVTLLFVDCSKASDSIQQIQLVNETVTVIMMLYKNMKAIARLPEGGSDFFDIVLGVLPRDTLAPYF